jgi:hypothetical protein
LTPAMAENCKEPENGIDYPEHAAGNAPVQD